MSIVDVLGDKFKIKEKEFRKELDPSKITIIRLDGMRFHTFTRPFLYPFDPYFRYCMDHSLLTLISKELRGYTSLVYFQSDEASIILPPITNEKDMLPFKGRVEKLSAICNQWNLYLYCELCSLIHSPPSLFTSHPLKKLFDIGLNLGNDLFYIEKYHQTLKEYIPLSRPGFDSRFIQVSIEDAQEYLQWRRMDAIRNFKNNIGTQFFSSKKLIGLSADEVIEMVESQYDIKYEEFPSMLKRGTIYQTNKFKNYIDHGFNEEDDLTKEYQDYVLQNIKNGFETFVKNKI
jgi:tRNA(His) 5'-end guanylyltransferase